MIQELKKFPINHLLEAKTKSLRENPTEKDIKINNKSTSRSKTKTL